MKGKNLIGKDKHTVKYQSLIKLVGRSKDKSNKIIHIHDK